MTADISRLIDEIDTLPRDWHTAGAATGRHLQAIAAHAQKIVDLRHSAETGSGKTTVLFSHLSPHHLVFAMEGGGSISQVQSSPLFDSRSVTYIEGPSQLTLPRYHFSHELQIVLIDGPHAYPFPDLEYYCFYPHISTGGLLLIDDIQIPTIARMYEILKADAMWELLEVVEGMAFLRRTPVRGVGPFSEGWWVQGYNASYYREYLAGLESQVPPSGKGAS
ncbi:MAG: class I SAM-dependent methyltransferase [Chlamydiota bacterium]